MHIAVTRNDFLPAVVNQGVLSFNPDARHVAMEVIGIIIDKRNDLPPFVINIAEALLISLACAPQSIGKFAQIVVSMVMRCRNKFPAFCIKNPFLAIVSYAPPPVGNITNLVKFQCRKRGGTTEKVISENIDMTDEPVQQQQRYCSPHHNYQVLCNYRMLNDAPDFVFHKFPARYEKMTDKPTAAIIESLRQTENNVGQSVAQSDTKSAANRIALSLVRADVRQCPPLYFIQGVSHVPPRHLPQSATACRHLRHIAVRPDRHLHLQR